jgi:dTDP-4-amino-4,6-dideoxygalactose transaminase
VNPHTPAVLGGDPAFPDGLPFFRPPRPPLAAVTERLAPGYEQGMLTNGRLVRQLEDEAAAYLDVPHVVAVASCTAGLMLTMQALTKAGTHVAMPSFTFSATAHAAAWAGAIPRFVECEDDTCQLDLVDAASRLDGASLLVATHLFGAPCNPEGVEDLGRRHGVPVMFDSAHAFGSTRRGRKVGGFGAAEVFSLSPTKPLIAGEGGLVATRDDDLAARLRLGRDYGNPGDYNTRFVGLNARMSELHAAVALASLAELEDHLAVRRDLADLYRKALADVPGVRVQAVDPEDASTYKDLTVLVDRDTFGLSRDGLVAALRAEGVDTRCYFSPPVHSQDAYAPVATDELPVTDRVAASVVSLPLWRDMPDGAVEQVVAAVARIGANGEAVAAAVPVTGGEG